MEFQRENPNLRADGYSDTVADNEVQGLKGLRLGLGLGLGLLLILTLALGLTLRCQALTSATSDPSPFNLYA